MSQGIRILFVEDSPSDLELAVIELRRAGFDFEHRQVDREDALVRELDAFNPDIILSDFMMPGFGGMEALAVVRARRPETPFLFLSGGIGEDRAIEALKKGATDYILKDRRARLVPCVRRAIEEVRERAERVRMEEEVKASEFLFRGVFENAAVGILLTDPQGRILRANPVFQKMIGHSEADMRRLNFSDLTHPEDFQRNWELFEEMIAGKRESFQVEKRYMRKGGSMFWARVTASVIKDESGKVRFTIGMVEDVAERKGLEEQLQQSQKMEAVGQLAGGVAHDFNNLIQAIMGYSDMALSTLKSEDPLRADIEQIGTAARRAAGLTRQLLAFSRRQVLQPLVLDLNAVIADFSKMLARLIGEDIDFVSKLKPGLGSVKADPGQIEQILMNLVVNARDAMPKGGKLTIETADVVLDEDYARRHAEVRPGPHVMLAVSDSGTGMDAATLKRIFEPFFTTKGVGKGTGLGLSTVYGIVKQSGGHVFVYSEPGIGTAFKVYLPRVDQAPEIPAAAAPSSGRRGTETVLIVEDEDSLRALSKRFLSAHGYTVREARRGDEALKLLEDGGVADLIVTDLIMPNMSGSELAKRAVALRPGVKVLIISGYTDDAVVRHGVLEHEVAFLSKPFNSATLLRKVREVLDAPAPRGPEGST